MDKFVKNWIVAHVRYNHYENEMKLPSQFEVYMSEEFSESEIEVLEFVK